jgi:hypothetical protein
MPGLGMQEIKKLFESFEVAYIDKPYDTFINLKTIEIDYNYFEQYKNQLVVINFSSENHLKFETHVYDQLSKTDINFLLLTYDYTQHLTRPRMLYFPYWSQWSKEQFSLKENFNNIDINEIKTYSLGCLNGNPRPHRIANYLKLRKRPYWNKTSVSFFNNASNDSTSRGDDLKLSISEVSAWSNIRSSLPAKFIGNSQSINLPQLTDSYLHLVTETTVSKHSIFITEKTWKAIASRVPFVMWGNPGTMDCLKQLGVDIYDDIIDHKYYDTEKNARIRLDKLHAVIDDLILQGVDKVYNQLSNRVAANQTKFFNAEFNQPYLSAILDAVKQYQSQ